MATANLIIKGKNNPTNLYLRFTNTRSIELICATGVSINPLFWDAKNQKIRNVIDVPNRDEINSRLQKLKIFVVDEFNLSFIKGEIIDKDWLKEKTQLFFSRPKFEDNKKNLNHHIYLSDFATWWLENKASTWKVKAGQYMDDKTKAHYDILNNIFIRFEGKNKARLKDIDNELLNKFSEFLTKEKYAEITAKRMIGRIRFFCNRAEEMNLDINKNYKQRVFVADQEEEYKSPYFNEDEINKIFKLDLSHNDTLDNVRDNLIIGLWTGLRVSDFLKSLKIDDIEDGLIRIKTQKTKTAVEIPLHPQVKEILKKRCGFLPLKINEQDFNDYIKNIAQICGFDNEMVGGIVKVLPDGKRRKIIGLYKKYELITSHICRRSFATNLHGKIDNSTICAIGGWATESQMLHYIKKSNTEHAEKLQKHWEKAKV